MKKTVMIMVGIICGIILGAVLVFNACATENEKDVVVIEYMCDLDNASYGEGKSMELAADALVEDGYTHIKILSSYLMLEDLGCYKVDYQVIDTGLYETNYMLVDTNGTIYFESGTTSLSFYFFKEMCVYEL